MADKKLSAEFVKVKQELLNEYSNIFQNQLDTNKANINAWAYKKTDNSAPIHPTIPFIGKNYFSSKIKVLLYASAENLVYLKSSTKERIELDDDEIAKDRCRYFFEKYLKEKPEMPFPFVHITPANNGALVIVAAYVLKKLDIDYRTPYELIEDIAVANFGKFSIWDNTSANKDYGNPDKKETKEKLDISFEYVKADMANLNPDILIIPGKIFEGFAQEKEFNNPNLKICPIFQITPTTINSAKTLGKYKDKYKRTKDVRDLEKWHENIAKYSGAVGGRGMIRGKTLDNFKAIYPYLDEICQKHKIKQENKC